jgi:antitoxin CcdA
VILPEPLLQEARAMGINLSPACERTLAAAVAEQRRTRWLEQKREAISARSEYVAENGLPLAANRQF